MAQLINILFPLLIITQIVTVSLFLADRKALDSSFMSNNDPIPLFSDITDIPERKSAFIKFLLPIAHQENERVQQSRDKLIEIKQKSKSGALDQGSKNLLQSLATQYRLQQIDLTQQDISTYADAIDKLLHKVDQVPESLIIAQAALESAWGTSRFATHANNFFGEWCFNKGCGLVPANREAGKSHEVQRFANVNESVRSYIKNINSHPAYEKLRKIRYQKRNANQPITGHDLTAGLGQYSALGEEYSRILNSMIRTNKLEIISACLNESQQCQPSQT